MLARQEGVRSPTAQRGLYARAWRDRGGLDKGALAVSAVLAAWIGSGLASTLEPEAGPPAAGGKPAAAAEPAAAARPATLPTCAEATAGGGAARVTCRTRTATLSLVQPGTPLLLDGLEARVGEARRINASTLEIDLRVRNTTAKTRVFNDQRRQVYANVADRRLYATKEASLPAGKARSLELRFKLPATAPASMKRVDVAVVPWGQAGVAKPRRLGVLQTRVASAAAAAPATP